VDEEEFGWGRPLVVSGRFGGGGGETFFPPSLGQEGPRTGMARSYTNYTEWRGTDKTYFGLRTLCIFLSLDLSSQTRREREFPI